MVTAADFDFLAVRVAGPADLRDIPLNAVLALLIVRLGGWHLPGKMLKLLVWE